MGDTINSRVSCTNGSEQMSPNLDEIHERERQAMAMANTLMKEAGFLPNGKPIQHMTIENESKSI